MPRPIPDVYRITPADSAETMMAELYSHFNGGSTKFTANTGTENGAVSGGDGFSVDPVDVGETWTANFRRLNTTDVNCLIDPAGTITDPGDTGSTPTSSSLSSPESNCFPAIPITGNVVLILEWDDAFMVLQEDATNVFYSGSAHIGRVLVPDSTDVALIGEDGLGIFGGIPTATAGSATAWCYSAGSATNQLRWGISGTSSNDWLSGDGIPDANVYNPLIGDCQTGNGTGGFAPCVVSFSKAGNARIIGSAKYWQTWYVADTHKTVIEHPDTGEDLYMYTGGYSTGVTTGKLIVPWPDATDPDAP